MLEVKELVAGYGSLLVLEGLTFHVPEGKVVALLGGNGAGKTTTMRALAGLIRISSGQIKMDSNRIDLEPSYRIHSLGLALVPQGRELFAGLTVDENLELGVGSRLTRTERRIQTDKV